MAVASAYQQSKLFLRISEKRPDLVIELKDSDEISYAYVLAKTNKVLSDTEAKEFLKNNYKDERIGLLIWCFGQMGLWDRIIEYDNKYGTRYS
jgi:hypothetical protein